MTWLIRRRSTLIVILVAGVSLVSSSRIMPTFLVPFAVALGVATVALAAYAAGVRDTLERLTR